MLRIGELAKRTGTSIRMLRYYEEQGLLQPTRSKGGYRMFEADAVRVVGDIRRLGLCGMTLPTIRQFLPCAIAGRSDFEPCDELKAILHNHIDAVGKSLKSLRESQELLNSLLHRIETRPI